MPLFTNFDKIDELEERLEAIEAAFDIEDAEDDEPEWRESFESAFPSDPVVEVDGHPAVVIDNEYPALVDGEFAIAFGEGYRVSSVLKSEHRLNDYDNPLVVFTEVDR